MTVPDQVLITELQDGSLEALGLLYDRHQRVVYRTALAVTGDPDAASDLLQDVFLRLHRFADRVDPERPLEPWLYRVTANLSYTWVKRRSRWIRPLADIADWLTGGKKFSPSQQVEEKDVWEPVRQAVLSLPLSHRVIVVMYYINDLPLQEIAEILDIPLGTVKSRLFYGRQAVKERLGLSQDEKLSGIQYEFT